jgi:hypothetical protein
MAIPPEPIEELLPRAQLVVVAEVTSIIAQGEQAPIPPSDPKRKGGPQVPLAEQVVALAVQDVLRGEGVTAGAELRALKPAADYDLSEGTQGPFLLAASDTGDPPFAILGRYGPDSYRRSVVEEALRASQG